MVQQLTQQALIVKKINNNNVLFSSSIPVARNPFCVLDEVKKTKTPYGVFRGQIIISGGYRLPTTLQLFTQMTSIGKKACAKDLMIMAPWCYIEDILVSFF